ncbi:hypothetical protein KI387_018789, partial [Taxus chinensis]
MRLGSTKTKYESVVKRSNPPDATSGCKPSISSMKNKSSSRKKGAQTPLQPRCTVDIDQLRRSSSLVEGSNSGRRSSSVISKQTKHDTRPIHDRNYQASLIKSINFYLQSHDFSLTLSPKSLPSGKDVKDIITFLVHQLDPAWQLAKLEDDVPFLFRQHGYPFQITKSALYAAGSPHSWPALLAALSWLVQLLNYKEKVEEKENADDVEDYLEKSYGCFLRGDDIAVQHLEQRFLTAVEEERLLAAQRNAAAETLVNDLEAKIKGLQSGTSLIDELNQKKAVTAEDVNKFHFIINNLSSKKDALEKSLVERKQEMETKNVEIEKLTKEIEELKQQVESQGINIRDYEKMNREYQSIEADIRIVEDSRNQWEKKAWELESSASKKLKELEGAIDRYNQDIIRLKLGSQFNYKLNSRGGTATEMLGVDFKATVRSGIMSSTEDYEHNYREMWEESLAVQQKLHEKCTQQERKRKVNAGLSAKIKKLEARYNTIQKSMEEYVSSKAAECERLEADVENNENVMKTKKQAEADSYLKKARLELEEITKYHDEKIQVCSNELLQLIDTATKYKEHVERKISSVKTALNETIQE